MAKIWIYNHFNRKNTLYFCAFSCEMRAFNREINAILYNVHNNTALKR